jgi:membrane complex biogenesis BtpA family protein
MDFFKLNYDDREDMMINSSNLLVEKMQSGKKCIVGMIHCLPLPGTLHYQGNMETIYIQALTDADILEKAGVDALMVENMGDKPYSAKLEPEQIAALAAITRMVVEQSSIPVGVDASFNDGVAGIAIACVSNAQFIRSPVFVDSVQATGLGVMHPCAKEVVRYRRLLEAENIGIWADIQVKHTFPIVPGIPLEESAYVAFDCGAEALIVTGLATGYETPLEAVVLAKKTVPIPVLVGSGFRYENARKQLTVANGAVVGSSIKKGGIIRNLIDEDLCRNLVNEVRHIQKELGNATG